MALPQCLRLKDGTPLVWSLITDLLCGLGTPSGLGDLCDSSRGKALRAGLCWIHSFNSFLIDFPQKSHFQGKHPKMVGNDPKPS